MTMTLSLPKSRKTIRQQEAVAAKLKQELKARGIRRKAQREKLVQKGCIWPSLQSAGDCSVRTRQMAPQP